VEKKSHDGGGTDLLAISFAYPPLAYPRSIQVARLLKFSACRTTLFCADEPGARTDVTIEPEPDSLVEHCWRVPFQRSRAAKVASQLGFRFYRPLWNRLNLVPDQYASWRKGVRAVLRELTQHNSFSPNAMATFGQPFSTHLIGHELKRRHGWPWLAHFSDPWVDNPFADFDTYTLAINRRLERAVAEAADLLVFTSQETVDLVMSKYPEDVRAKARVLSQSFDPAAYDGPEREPGRRVVLRYVGNFYGHRTPEPLVRALRVIAERSPRLLDGVTFEIIGPLDRSQLVSLEAGGLPDGLITVHPGVDYTESIGMIRRADGLLVIDAPAELSVFLPSKLIDYIGAARPILGLTPPGAAARLIERVGGLVADPRDDEAMAGAVESFIALCRGRRSSETIEPWGVPEVRAEFEASAVAARFDNMIAGIS
jgi:hypothetical protein